MINLNWLAIGLIATDGTQKRFEKCIYLIKYDTYRWLRPIYLQDWSQNITLIAYYSFDIDSFY